MTVESAFTFTTSFSAPTSKATSTVFACAASTMTLSREIVLKPEALTSTLYDPGSTASRRKPPSPDDLVSRTTFVALLVILIVAPPTTAPEGSVTVPAIIPLLDCARTELLADGNTNPDIIRSV